MHTPSRALPEPTALGFPLSLRRPAARVCGVKPVASFFVVLLLAVAATTSGQPTVTESARNIPVATSADVIVVGGTCGAVAAATSAAKTGASVFLIAPRTYLGEDMAGTLRLWLEPGETPTTDLARQLYTDPLAGEPPGLPFAYRADQISNEKHKESNPPSRLNLDRIPLDPANDSVQYDNDVTITADLETEARVQEIQIRSFTNRRDYQVGTITTTSTPATSS